MSTALQRKTVSPQRFCFSVQGPKITPREKQVLHLIAHEYSSKEIAEELYVSYETVNSHRKNIMTKLNVKNTAGMVRVAFEMGLMTVNSNAIIYDTIS